MLRALGVPLAFPTYVPQGYRVTNVITEPGHGPGLPGYQILFRRGADACFVFESGRGGLGGDDLSKFHSVLVHSAFLGDPPMEYRGAAFFLAIDNERTFDGRWYDVTASTKIAPSACKRSLSLTEAVHVAESIGPYVPR